MSAHPPFAVPPRAAHPLRRRHGPARPHAAARRRRLLAAARDADGSTRSRRRRRTSRRRRSASSTSSPTAGRARSTRSTRSRPSTSTPASRCRPTNLRTERKTGAAFPSPFKFKKYGKCGLEVSELFANTAKHIDDICVIRSMHADVPNHEPSFLLMNCGEARLIRPSVGSWVTYGLGTENQNLPGFVAMCPGGYPLQESQNWQAGFLPGVFQGTYVDTQAHRRGEARRVRQEQDDPGRPTSGSSSTCSRKLNGMHQDARPNDPQLEARIQSFELAYRMQTEATDAFDVTQGAEARPRRLRPRRAGPAACCSPAGWSSAGCGSCR